LNSKFKVDEEAVRYTHRLINLAIEIDEYWRRTAPLHKLSREELENLLKLLNEIEELVSKLKEKLSFKP